MRKVTVAHVLARFLGLDGRQWFALGIVAALWVGASLIARQVAASGLASLAESGWWPYVRTTVAGIGFNCVTLIALQSGLPPTANGGRILIRLAYGAPIILAGLASEFLTPALNELVRGSPGAPSLLTLVVLLGPAVLFALLGPSAPAAVADLRPPLSAIRVGFRLTQGMRLKLCLISISWAILSFAISGVLVWTSQDEYRSFFLAARDLFLIPPAVFMAFLYLERTPDAADQDPAAVFD